MPRLRIEGGTLDGTFVPIPPGRLVIGRSADCDVRVPDPQVSRYHCAIVQEGDILRVSDLGSKQGTRLNGQLVRLGHRRLRHGDSISVADYVFHVEFVDFE
jgi:pSer/pThr/pTyr-binding forkhead associated (FHA) protein